MSEREFDENTNESTRVNESDSDSLTSTHEREELIIEPALTFSPEDSPSEATSSPSIAPSDSADSDENSPSGDDTPTDNGDEKTETPALDVSAVLSEAVTPSLESQSLDSSPQDDDIQSTGSESASTSPAEVPATEAQSGDDTPTAMTSSREDHVSEAMWAAVRDRRRVLTGEEVEMPGEETPAEDIVGSPSPVRTSQIEPVTIGAHTTTIPVLTPDSADDTSSKTPPASTGISESDKDPALDDMPTAFAASPASEADATPDTVSRRSLFHKDTPDDVATQPSTTPESTDGTADEAFTDIQVTDDATPSGLEDTTMRRRSLMTATPVEGETQLEAAWKPRSEEQQRALPESTPASLDDAIFSGATVTAHVPTRGGAHWLSLIMFILATPVAWYLLSDSGARMTLSDNSPMVTGVINALALGELIGGLLLVVILFVIVRRSSLGAWISGVLWTIAGIPWVVIPALWAGTILPGMRALDSWNSFGANIAHHLQASGYSGRMLLAGLTLLGIGYVSHSVRRRGREEEALRAEVEKVNPTGAFFTARERRRAEKAAGLR